MNNLGVIDHFTNVFFAYIDSGFGLLGGEVRFLTATLVAIDVTLAGLFWAMGGGDDVIARLIKKVLYVGAFAFILTNFASLATIILRSFAGLGLTATASPLTPADLLRPGRLAAAGVDAARPILSQLSELTGFPDVFTNLDSIAVLGFAWLIVIVSFFVLAVQLFVTLIEFKLTTLAGFVLVPFALWNKTAFLAERVLGNVVSAGIKVLVLAVIVGIGSSLFGDFVTPAGQALTIDNALAVMLASLALLGLGLFGPGIATGLVAGAPQLGAGAAAGTALAGAGLGIAAGAATVGAARLGAGALKAAWQRAPALLGQEAVRMRPASAAASGAGESTNTAASAAHPPGWAQRLRSKFSHGASTTAHVARSADRPAAGPHPNLKDE